MDVRDEPCGGVNLKKRSSIRTSVFLCFVFLFAPPVKATEQIWLSGQDPEWRLLDRYQGGISRGKFEDLLRRYYSPDGGLLEYLEITDASVTFFSDKEHSQVDWKLRFTDESDSKRLQKEARLKDFEKYLEGKPPWRSDKPLAGITICLDPGHIGGTWSQIEERHMQVRWGSHPPVKEGDLTILTCQKLEPLLAEAGATVLWTRKANEPITPLRPEDLDGEVLDVFQKSESRLMRHPNKRSLRLLLLWRDMLFYRVFEIAARAEKIEKFQPDLTLCIHYNAAPDRRPMRPRLFRVNKLVVFVQGSYMARELEDEWQRYHLMRKLLEGSIQIEIGMGEKIGESIAKNLESPPENYLEWTASNPASDNPYVWSRNLLANRLFNGPTVFIEGPYMNDRTMFYRLIEGDYDGERTIRGKKYRSIFREFAETLAEGIIEYYKENQAQP